MARKKKLQSGQGGTESNLLSTSADLALSSIQKTSTDYEKIKKLLEKRDNWYNVFNQHIQRARNYLTFLYIDQWEWNERQARESLGKPTLTFDKIVPILNGIYGDFRDNTPALSVRGLDENTPQSQIDWRTDLIRQIHCSSRADVQYQNTLKNCIETGWGGLKVSIEFENADTFQQCIKIAAIRDYQTAFWDPSAQLSDKSDGDFCGWYDLISRDDFELAYPEIKSPQGTGNNYFYRADVQDLILVTNIYEKQYYKKTIAMLSDGQEMEISKAKELIEKNNSLIKKLEEENNVYALFQDQIQPLEIIQTRQVLDYKIKYYRLIDNAILAEGEWPGKILPIIYVEGNSTTIDAEQIPISYIQGVIDTQKLINYNGSQIVECIVRARKEQFIGTKKNFEGHEEMWRNPDQVQGALIANYDNNSGMPQRYDPTSFDPALLNAMNLWNQEIGSILGRYDENRGNESNAQSGIAIDKRQRAGNMPINMYIDNVARGIEQVGKIILELLPAVYGTANRLVATQDAKGNTNTIRLNQQTGSFQQNDNGDYEEVIKNDVNKGKYDIEVRVDGSYDQQRLDALNTLMQFAQIFPPMAPLMPDLMAKNSGLEDSQVLVERAQTLLPQNIQAMEKGQPPPHPQQPPPDPKTMIDMQKLQLQNRQLDIEQQRLELEKFKVGQDSKLKTADSMMMHFTEQQKLAMEKYKANADIVKEKISADKDIHKEHIKGQYGLNKQNQQSKTG